MKRILRYGFLALLLALALAPGLGGRPQREGNDVRLPNGKMQKDEILKEDHEKNLRDAASMIEMAQALQQELEKNDRHVLSVSSIRKTEEIEKLAKQIRSRMRRL